MNCPVCSSGVERLQVLSFLIGVALVGGNARPACGQLLRRAIVLEGARIETMDGPVIEHGSLVISGDTIRSVGEAVKVPLLSRRVDAKGGTLTPGLIDAWSILGRETPSANAPGGARRRAEDDFDHYDTTRLRGAVRQGVTAAYVSPRGPNGICGLGAVMRLTGAGGREGPCGSVLQGEAALCIDLNSADKPVTRLKTLQAVRKQLLEAREYRRSLDDYQEELAEYAQKLEQQNGEKAKARDKSDASATEKKDEDSEQQKDKKSADSKKSDKPRRPSRKPELEVLLRALDREIPVRIAADRSGDILNALDLAREFSLDLILEGAAEAHLVAKQIAAAQALVVLGQLDIPARRRNDPWRLTERDLGSWLDSADVHWIVGSGAQRAERARFVALNAQMAAAYNPDRTIRLVTVDAARALRVDRRIGRLRPGLLADCVLWSGDPRDPASQVLRVYVGGKLVYSSDE